MGEISELAKETAVVIAGHVAKRLNRDLTTRSPHYVVDVPVQEIQRAIDSAVTARTEQIAQWVDGHTYDWTLADKIRALPQEKDDESSKA